MAAREFRDEIKFESGPSSKSNAQRILIYFLPGNPGVVEYYRRFLSKLHDTLCDNLPQTQRIITYGHSHVGFELGTPKEKGGPFSLDETIEAAKLQLYATACEEVARSKTPVKVVLVGHSVGAYMLMEILRWWQEFSAHGPGSGWSVFEIVGGVCLFPTIVDIAKSPKGRVMKWLLAIPFLHIAASLLAVIISQFIPSCLFNWPKAFTPGENPDQTYIDLTKAVIESRSGAKQAVYLAAHEMKQIREDKWHPSRIWGADDPQSVATEATATKADPASQRTKLFFYWGDNDYWVDNATRDKLLERAGRSGDKDSATKPTMVVDSQRMDHCFSLDREHCDSVAREVAEWICRSETGIVEKKD